MTDTTEQGVVETPAPDANAQPDIPADTTPETTAADQDSSPDADGDSGEASEKPRGGFQKRISELTRNWRETEREAARKAAEAEYWRELALRNSRPEPEPQPTVPVPAAPEPVKTLADFNYDEAAYAAHLAHIAEQRAETAAERKWRELQERDAAQRRQQTFQERLASFAKTTPDFDAVVRNPAVPITKQIVDIVSSSEDAPEVLYTLGKNPEEAARIARLDPVAAARELGKIEARLAFERAQASKPAVSKPAVSQAPPPPPKIEASEPQVDKDPDQMPVEEWLKWRNKQLSRKR